MKYLKETTGNWTTSFKMPNHIYILDGTVCVGYIREGTDTETWFDHPLKNFDKTRRTFKELKSKKAINEEINTWLSKAQ